MAMKTVEKARREVEAVLRRYRVRWEEVAPDRDEEIWKSVRPAAKRIRKDLFRKSYPSLR